MCRSIIILIVFSIVFSVFGSFRLYSQDSILLQEIIIENNLKKQKLKKIKIGTHDLKYTDNALFFTEDPIYYIVDSLPEGGFKI